MRELRCFAVDPIRSLLAPACSYEVNSNSKNGFGWLPYNFDYSLVSRVHAHAGVNLEGPFTQAEILVSYWSDYATEVMRLDFAELAARHFKSGGFDIHGILSIFNQGTVTTVRIAEVEEVAPSGGASVHEELGKIVEPDVVVEDDDEDWDLEGTNKAVEVEACGLHGTM